MWPQNAFLTTKNGRLGLGQGKTAPGDFVCIWFDVDFPLIQRSQDDGLSFELIGQAYVDDLMDGEIFKLRDFEKDGCDKYLIR